MKAKNQIGIISFLSIVVIGIVLVAVTTLSGCMPTMTLGKQGFDVHDPVREAEATRVAIAAQDEAAHRAVERRILEAQADKARVEVEAAQTALPAATLRNVLIYTGIGTGILVLAIGSAFGLAAWLNKRATSIYPNGSGQYPLIIRKGWGWFSVHDANRNLGSAAVYRVPTPLDQVVQSVAAIVAFIRTGQPPALISPMPEGDFPQAGSEPAVLQTTTQAQAVQLMAGATRGASQGSGVQKQVSNVAARLISPASILGDERRPILPPVTVISEPHEFEQFKQTYVPEAARSDWYE